MAHNYGLPPAVAAAPGLRPAVAWRIGGALVDARLVPLLAGIAAAGSLATAAKACGVSYRAAWDLVARYRDEIGAPLVTLERGRGARLAPAGEALLKADARGRVLLDRELGALDLDGATVNGRARASTQAAPPPPLRIAASHDLVLERLLSARSRAHPVELAFSNSLQALATYARGDADAAGFHVALAPEVAESTKPFLTYLDADRDVLVRFADREQGLILPRGNPRRVSRLEQVARRGLRFVTRQRGSGTRLLVEALLARAGVRPGTIEGYASQAPTHYAVAEAVAAGRADVGFGLAAAARAHGLDFVLVTRERYFLAARRARVKAGALDPLLVRLRGRQFRRIASTLAGYDIRGAGTLAHVATLGPALPVGWVR
jgi:molybdate transport repressor ModE-like protein